jgi:hypothetical protein
VRDRLGRTAASSHLHVLWFVQELLRELQHFRGHRRREEQCLTLGGQRGQNTLHIGPEAHVQHAIRFVEDQDLEA